LEEGSFGRFHQKRLIIRGNEEKVGVFVFGRTYDNQKKSI
jgi:hypothetical protein